MRIEALFRSRVGRRMLLLFVLCALVPVSVLAALSYWRITGEIYGQSREQLLDQAKTTGLVVVERLMFAQSRLDAATRVVTDPDAFGADTTESWTGLSDLTLVAPDGAERFVLGHLADLPAVTPVQEAFLDGGRAILATDGAPVRVLLAQRVGSREEGPGTLWARVDPEFLWSTTETYAGLTGDARLCVLDAASQPLYCAGTGAVDALELQAGWEDRAAGLFDWQDAEAPYLAAYRKIFLGGAFMAPSWTIVVSELQTGYLELLAGFRSTFLLSLAAALTLVTLLSTVQIRRSLYPLRKLIAAARRVASADFEVRVSIDSGDEFEAMGTAFNRMAGQLGRQFRMLTAVTNIERSALGSLSRRQIVETVVDNLLTVFEPDVAGLFLIGDDKSGAGKSYSRAPGDPMVVGRFRLSAPERAQMARSPRYFNVEGRRPRYLDYGPAAESGVDHFLMLPIHRDTRLAGVAAIGTQGGRSRTQEDMDHARQIADHAALALANVSLIAELDELQIGSLTALARAVDAKSPWTSGHSERVTTLSVAIGEAMGLESDQLGLLRRGGLLHDIGKIGVPASILDKPGPLTPEEWVTMREHPNIGVRILEPLGAFRDILPMVREHHERFDGEGYPEGKLGQEIHPLARILAVADVFDAITSERPYRESGDADTAVRFIREGAGTRFDAEVVEAFVQVVTESQERLRASLFDRVPTFL